MLDCRSASGDSRSFGKVWSGMMQLVKKNSSFLEEYHPKSPGMDIFMVDSPSIFHCAGCGGITEI